ncbi:MAG: glycoside hydrolase family protein [Conexibacter sp.]
MPRFVEVAGCPCPAELAPFVRTVMRRTGVAPVTIYRGSEPDALAILHAHGKHSQAELRAAWEQGRAAQLGIRGIPDMPGQSTHELRSDGRAFPGPIGRVLDPIQCGMDWPIPAIDHVMAELNRLGCRPIHPYGSATTEAQHVCCTVEGRLGVLARLRTDPIMPGDHSEIVRRVQVYLVRAGLLPHDFDVAERIGTYGPRMVAAVIRFQQSHGLDDDGIVGPKTFAALRRRFGARGSALQTHTATPASASTDGSRDGKLRLSPAGLRFIKRFEGFRPTVYNDGRGVPTIGYGETHPPLPRRISEPEAARLLARRLDQDYEPAVRALFRRGGLPFNQNRYDALVSFAYNLGPASVQGVSGFETIGRAIRARNLNAIAEAMPLYSNPHDPNVHEGLLRRRKAEARLFLAPARR